MKTLKKKVFCTLLTGFMILLMAAPFRAAESILHTMPKKQTLEYCKNDPYTNLILPCKGAKKVSVKSKNKKVLDAVVKMSNGERRVVFFPHKYGTAKVKLSYKLNGKEYKRTITVKVVKYKQKVASLKVGSKNLASAIKKTSYGKAGACSGEITWKPKSGYTITFVGIDSGSGYFIGVKEGQNVSLKKNDQVLVKISKGEESWDVVIVVK